MIFTIADLHLSFGVDKPMDIFGWENYEEKIKEDWLKNVTENDTVIIPGDFSWAMTLDETIKDFDFLNSLQGKKIILKGNHDYWWNSITKMKKFLVENNFRNIDFLHNNAFFIENKIIVGTRGWINNDMNQENYRILKRENDRLKLSIDYGIQNFGCENEMICFMHYPPFYKENVPDEIDFVKLMSKYDIKKCFYGHLHGEALKDNFEGKINDTELKLVSADYLHFKLHKIC